MKATVILLAGEPKATAKGDKAYLDCDASGVVLVSRAAAREPRGERDDDPIPF